MKTNSVRIFLSVGIVMAALVLKAQGTIDVNFVKLASDEGQVIVSLFSQDKGFPAEFEEAFRSEKVTVEGGQAKYTFEDVPWGEYAVTVMHDENGNDEIEKNFLGIPKEKVGMSNIRGGIPSFKRAVFSLSEDQDRAEIIIEPVN